MSFINPAVLWALPLAAAPLLLHLLSRRRAKEVRFGDLTFLRQIYARAMPRARLRQWLLIAARCLLLFCLVLAYAGPVLQAHGGAGSQASEGLDLVLWLDASYSMGYREGGKTRFETARAAGESLVRALKPADRVAVGVFSDRQEFPAGALAWVSPREALETLARAQLGFRGTDYAAPLKAAQELLSKDRPRRRAAVLLSDGARHGFRGAWPPLDPDVSWFSVKFPAAEENSYISFAGPARESSADKPRLSVRVSGLKSGVIAPLDLWVGDQRVLGTTLKGGTPEAEAALDLPPARDARAFSWSGRAALRPDALSADDSYFFSFRHPKRPRVLCLYGDPGFLKAPNGGYFLKQLLGGSGESLLDYQGDFLELARFDEARLSDYRIVVLADVKEVPAAAAAELDRFVRRGGGLWVLPGARGAGGEFSALDGWLPARFGPPVEGEAFGLKPAPSADPKLWREFELAKVGVRTYYLLQTRADAKVWFSSPTGYPLLVSGPRGAGRVAVWASALDAEWTNLALKPAFAPWVETVLGILSPLDRRQESFDLKVGEPIARVWKAEEPAPASVRVRSPDGRATTLWLKGRKVEYSLTARPGLYEMIEEGTGKRAAYAVNLDRSSGESDLTPNPSQPWKALKSDSIPEDFWLAVSGRDARGGMLAAAAALLLLEMFLALPRAAAGLLILGLACGPARAEQGDRFVWAQLKIGPRWDPYPGTPGAILSFVSKYTSVLTAPERRVLDLKDKELFSSPLVVLAGREAPAALDEEDLRRLRNYLTAGGLLWIEDVSGNPASSFDGWVRRTLPKVLPDAELSPLEPDHVLFKTFFLLRGASGRVMVRAGMEGVPWGGRTAVLYSRNDLLGVWAEDALGKPLYPCVPGGEAQRYAARKLALNIVMYVLTGNYKSDAVHQPFLLQKMRSGIP